MLRQLLGFALLALGIAHGAPGRETDRKIDGPRLHRNLDYDIKDNRFSLRSMNKSDESKSAYRFSFRTVGFPLLLVQYMTKSSDTISKSQFAVGFFSLVEYNSSISVKDSTNKVRLSSGQGTWGSFVVSDGTYDDVAVKIVNNTWTYKTDSKLTFSLQAMALQGAGAALTPNTFKYSVEIKNFPYKMEKSKLALVKFIRSKSAQKSTSDKVETDAGNLTWSSEVEVKDKKKVKVELIGDLEISNTTDESGEIAQNGEGDRLITLAFAEEQPSYVYWDPELTVADPAISYAQDGLKKSSATVVVRSGLLVCSAMIMTVSLFFV